MLLLFLASKRFFCKIEIEKIQEEPTRGEKIMLLRSSGRCCQATVLALIELELSVVEVNELWFALIEPKLTLNELKELHFPLNELKLSVVEIKELHFAIKLPLIELKLTVC
jgi:hypothetical protein